MDRLGYSRYLAQGGDWGAQVTTWMGALDPEHCAAIHLNMAPGIPPESPSPLDDEERADLAVMKRFAADESGYANEQGTKPQTVGMVLNDSPAGLLGWTVEKFQSWSDCDGDLESCFTRDQIITNVMLYWVTQTSASAARLSWETRRAAARNPPFLTVPTGLPRTRKRYFVGHGRGSSVSVMWCVGSTCLEVGTFPPWNSPNSSPRICGSSSEPCAEL